jgi:hypothetical protein
LGWQRTVVAVGDGKATQRKLGIDGVGLWGSSGLTDGTSMGVSLQ